MYFNRKHRAAQDRPDTFLHYCLLPCRFPAPCRQGNGNAGDLHHGPPRSPTIEIICFLPSGTKRLFFRSEKQKRSYRTALFPLLPFFNFSVYYHAKLHIITETPSRFRVYIISPIFPQHFPANQYTFHLKPPISYSFLPFRFILSRKPLTFA